MDTQQARTRLEALLAELDESAAVVQSDGGAETGELTERATSRPADYAANVVDADAVTSHPGRSSRPSVSG